MKRFSLILLLFALLSHGFSQDEKRLLKALYEEDREALDALVMYPEDVREAILQVATQPEILVRMDGLQNLTATEFRTLLENYPQEKQEQFYDLVRFPELVVALVDRGKLTRQEIKDMSIEYPAETQEIVLDLGRNDFGTLIQIRQLQKEFRFALAQIKSDYDVPVQESIDKLIGLPEVLDLLTENYRLTLLIGSLYVKDPYWVHQQLDSLGLVQARQNAKELEDWKEALEADPEALQELEASAESFAETQGYTPDQYRRERQQVTVVHHYQPYSYWFGYPHWYQYPWWYSYPYWHHWGFYYGSGGRVVIYGMPSWHYLSWHWHYPQHWQYYPHFSNCLVTHYQHHRQSSQSLSRTTRSWVNQNQQALGRDFVSREEGRINRIQEHALFEMDYREYTVKKQDKSISRADYLSRNVRKYPDLGNIERTTVPVTTKPRTDRPINVKPDPKPRTQPVPNRVNPTPQRRVPVYKPPQPAVKPKTLPPRRDIRINPNPTNRQKINQGNQRHQQQWQPPKIQQRPAPTPSRKVIKPAKSGGKVKRIGG